MNAIMVIVEPPMSDNIGEKFGNVSASPIINATIAVRKPIRLQPNSTDKSKAVSFYSFYFTNT